MQLARFLSALGVQQKCVLLRTCSVCLLEKGKWIALTIPWTSVDACETSRRRLEVTVSLKEKEEDLYPLRVSDYLEENGRGGEREGGGRVSMCAMRPAPEADAEWGEEH